MSQRYPAPILPTAAPLPTQVEITPTGHIDVMSVDYQPQVASSVAVLRKTADDWVRCLSSPDTPENRALFIQTRTRMNDAEMLHIGYRPGMPLLPRPQNVIKLPQAAQGMLDLGPLLSAVAPVMLEGLNLPDYARSHSLLGHVYDLQRVNRPYNLAVDVVASNLEAHLDYGVRTLFDRTCKMGSIHFELQDGLASLHEFIRGPAEEAQETRKKIARALSDQAPPSADPKAPPPTPPSPASPPTPATPTPGLDPRYRG
jgi:hypothetical protein